MQINVYIHCDPKSVQVLEQTMSQLSDKIAALTASVDAALVRSADEVASLKKQIASLQLLVDSGSATPEDLAAIDALTAKLEGLDPTNPTTTDVPTPGA